MGQTGLKDLLWVAAFSTCVKLLLVPSYRSTDFEVHRHWLAITHSLPLKGWYLDVTSQWTLDYPPFFAWFERFLACFANQVDPRIVSLTEGLNYASERVILFQRGTVMLADGVLYWGLWSYCRNYAVQKQRILYAAVILSPGLLIVDHIHFQYNGFLLGMLLLSLASLRDGNDVIGGLWFTVLVCFKHLFAVAGPIYFFYLLRHYCRGPKWFARFLSLAFSVSTVVAVAFGPFVYYGQAAQVLRRLFPFGRGLSHAYWAPNVWAIYNTIDKVLVSILHTLGFEIHVPQASMTGGLVGDSPSYAVLPQITPTVTAVLITAALLPCVIRIWKYPRQSDVVRWIAYAYTCGFLFGWHVHEKASLHFVIPFSLLAVDSVETSAQFLFMCTVSCFSLFPLLFESREYPVKVLLLVIYSVGMFRYLSYYSENSPSSNKRHPGSADIQERVADGQSKRIPAKGNQGREFLGTYRSLYLLGLVPLEIYSQFIHSSVFNGRFPFVPLMLISVYCSLGMLYVWSLQLYHLSMHTSATKCD